MGREKVLRFNMLYLKKMFDKHLEMFPSEKNVKYTLFKAMPSMCTNFVQLLHTGTKEIMDGSLVGHWALMLRVLGSNPSCSIIF